MVTKKKTSKKKAAQTFNQQTPYLWLAYGLGAGLITYGFASWAIDSGSYWHYIGAFIGVYFTARYLKRFIKEAFFNNESSRKKA